MWFWGFFAVIFGLLTLALAYFAWAPDRLLALHQFLTGNDAERELDGAQYTFMRITRRASLASLVICLTLTGLFTRTAVDYARTQEIRDQHDAARFEKIRKSGVGALYSGNWQNGVPPKDGPPARPGK